MRGRFNRVGRGVLALGVVAMLAGPVQAKPIDEGWSPSRLINAMKRFVVTTFGDGLITPRP